MSASEAKHDMYVDDILASKDGKDIVENVVDIDRGLPTEGVLTLYLESMSNLNGVYSALEGILREVFDPMQSFPDSKYKINLYLEIREHFKKTANPEERVTPMIDSYVVEIDTANVESKLHCFKFIEKHVSRNHIINNWKHLPLQLTEEKLSALAESTLVVSLYLECSPIGGGGKVSRRLCGQAQIPLEGVLSAPNQDGCKETVGMVSETKEIVCYLNCNLNFSKGGFERGNNVIEELKEDMKSKTEDLKNNRVFIRLTELILLNFQPQFDNKRSQKRVTSQKRFTTLTLTVRLGKFELKSLELRTSESYGDLFRLSFDGSETSDDFTFSLDMANIERYITDKAMLEKFLNSKTGNINFHALPPFSLELSQTEDSVKIKEIGKFEFNLVELLVTKDKWETKGLLSTKAFIPLICQTGGYPTSPSESSRLGIDIVVLKTNKIKNKHTLEDLAKILSNQRLRSLRLVQQSLISMPSASYLQTDTTFDVPSITRLLKSEYKFSNSEISEIIDLLGRTSDGKEVDFFKIITSPLMVSLTKTAAEANDLGMNLEELLRVEVINFRNFSFWTLKGQDM
jgi:hypothetical protein